MRLEEENEQLKHEISKLKATIKELKKELELKDKKIQDDAEIYREWINNNGAYYQRVIDDYRIRMLKILHEKQVRLDIKDIEFHDGKTPYLLLGRNSIKFSRKDDKTAILAKSICRQARLKKMLKSGATVEEIYNWFGLDDWFDITQEARKKFKADLYQWFRNINTKALPLLDNRKMIVQEENIWRLNRDIFSSK